MAIITVPFHPEGLLLNFVAFVKHSDPVMIFALKKLKENKKDLCKCEQLALLQH